MSTAKVAILRSGHGVREPVMMHLKTPLQLRQVRDVLGFEDVGFKSFQDIETDLVYCVLFDESASWKCDSVVNPLAQRVLGSIDCFECNLLKGDFMIYKHDPNVFEYENGNVMYGDFAVDLDIDVFSLAKKWNLNKFGC